MIPPDGEALEEADKRSAPSSIGLGVELFGYPELSSAEHTAVTDHFLSVLATELGSPAAACKARMALDKIAGGGELDYEGALLAGLWLAAADRARTQALQMLPPRYGVHFKAFGYLIG